MTESELKKCLDNPAWRLSNLYKIIVKGDDPSGAGDLVVTFKPNRAQRRLLGQIHNRNIILKARQLGFTTLVCMLWLDTAIFSPYPIRCAVIAQDKDAAESIFAGKIRFAYDNLPDEVKTMYPLKRATQSELVFHRNNASIKVATSVRSGTIHRLHVSEFGKICAKYPDKAREVVTGSIPAVTKTGLAIIESTAEGQDGHFYNMTQAALAKLERGEEAGLKDWVLHFFSWHEAPEYRLTKDMRFSKQQLQYMSQTEARLGKKLAIAQWNWYWTTVQEDFGGEQPLMWQEYPSFPEEAFQQSTEGCWYSEQLSRARVQGRVVDQLPVVNEPVNTFWDVGRGDMTAIWLHQRVGTENRFIGYYENSGEDLIHYAQHLQSLGYLYGTHYLPHECSHKRMGLTPDSNKSIKEMLESVMQGQRFEIVPRITNLSAGIQATRNAFPTCWFDAVACEQGLKRLANYKKAWNKTLGCWKDQDVSDDNAHGADAFRQFAQAQESGDQFKAGAASATIKRARRTSWRRGSPLAV